MVYDAGGRHQLPQLPKNMDFQVKKSDKTDNEMPSIFYQLNAIRQKCDSLLVTK